MDHIWTVACRLSITDIQRNTISLIEIVEAVSFTGKFENSHDQPVGLPFPIELVSSWSRSQRDTPEVSRARILIYSPEGVALNLEEGHEYSVDLSQYQRIRVMGGFDMLPFAGNGTYTFVVQQFNESNEQWESVATIPLELVMLPPEN